MPTRRAIRLTCVGCAVILAVVVVALPTGAYHEASEPSDGTVRSFIVVDPPREIPSFAFFDVAGNRLTLRDFSGKVVLLNIWATWCPPCLRELPALDRLQGRLGGPDFVVVPVSVDRQGMTVAARFYKRLGISNLDLYLDPSAASGKAVPIDVLPATYVLDRKGRVISYLRSFADWDAPEATQMIQNHIAAPVP